MSGWSQFGHCPEGDDTLSRLETDAERSGESSMLAKTNIERRSSVSEKAGGCFREMISMGRCAYTPLLHASGRFDWLNYDDLEGGLDSESSIMTGGFSLNVRSNINVEESRLIPRESE